MPFFLHPLFLLGGLAIAGPLLYHLLLRNRPKSQILPTLRFLPATSSQTIAFHKLKNLLLLFLRIMILLLITGAFARPYFKKASQMNDSAPAPEGAIFALDVSLSMHTSDRWETAVRRTRMILDTIPKKAPAGLIFFDRTPRIIFSNTKDKSRILSALEAAKPGYGGTDLPAAIRSASELAEKLAAENCRIFLISDFQDTGFKQISTKLKLPPKVKLVPIRIDNQERINAAITNAKEIFIDQKDKRLIRIQMERFAEGVSSGKLFIKNNGTILASKDVTINGGKSEIHNIEIDIDRKREEIIWIHLDVSDELPEDNLFPLLLQEDKPIPVLLPVSAENSASQKPPNPFFQAAIDSFGTRIEPKALPLSQLESEEAREYPVAIMESTIDISEPMAQYLKAYIQKGGCLILFPGKGGDNSLNKFIDLETSQWETLNGDSGEFRIVSSTCGQGRFSFMDNPGKNLLGHPRIFRYWKLNNPPSDRITHIASLDDGSPFLVEWKMGSGAIYLFTTSLDSKDSDFVLRPTFSPFLFKLIDYGAGRSREKRDYLVGDIILVNNNPKQTILSIRDLEGNPVPGEGSVTRLTHPGFFRIDKDGKEYTIQAALERNESDLRPMNPKRIESLAMGDPETKKSSNADRNNRESFPNANISIEASARFWWWMLIAALLLMATESLVASRTLR